MSAGLAGGAAVLHGVHSPVYFAAAIASWVVGLAAIVAGLLGFLQRGARHRLAIAGMFLAAAASVVGAWMIFNGEPF